MSETKSKIIGIDLGTSNSAAAFMNMGRPELIPSSEGAGLYGKAFPSVVAFPREGPPVVGETAKNYPPSRTITTIKRKMGIKHKQNIDGKDYTPEQISALILRKIKSDAENRIGQKVEKVVITVPAYFDANQRKATEDAGKIAGLDVIRLLDEPTAAALSYGFDKKDLEQKVMVFDFGGGTLDITIMDIGGGVLNVITTTGDTQLGGEDMTQAILDYFKDEVKQQRQIPSPVQGIDTELWLTRKLWGVASEAPFLHHGRATLISEAILMHGGEAEPQRLAYEDLSEYEQDSVVEFIKTLQILPEESTTTLIDPLGPNQNINKASTVTLSVVGGVVGGFFLVVTVLVGLMATRGSFKKI